MEKRDLYDFNRNLTGETIFKGEAIPKNKYILVVLSFIENSEGKFLIQKRSIQKNGKYASTGGHPKSGETSLQGMLTEIKEEIGLSLLPTEPKLIFSGREDSSQIFYDIYYIKKDFEIEDLQLQEEEVESVKWNSVSEIQNMINNNTFLRSHIEEFYRILEYKKSNITI